MIKIQFEGIIQHINDVLIDNDEEEEYNPYLNTERVLKKVKQIIKIAIDNETYCFELVGGLDLRYRLTTNHRVRLKGVLDIKKMVIRDPSDIWVKLK